MATTEAHPEVASSGKLKIVIDPVTRIEGHMKLEVLVENGKVVDAWCIAPMYRGIENIVAGRDPRDAPQILQRICGVCPTAHATASCNCVDDACGLKGRIKTNGRVTRNLIFGSNYLQSHILHFYHLAALDFVKGPDTAPFVPRYTNPDLRLPAEVNKVGVDQYLKALKMREVCHEMVALFGGRMPHVQALVAGGAAESPTKDKLAAYLARFKDVVDFVTNEYVPTVYLVGSVYKDLLKTGIGYKNALCYGVFPETDDNSKFLLSPGVYYDGKDQTLDIGKVREFVKYSWYTPDCGNLHPSKGKTVPDVHKKNAYSFSKAPRYDGKAMEVGPVARLWVNNPELSPMGQKQLKDLLGINAKKFRDLGDACFSIMGRHIARAEEAYMVTGAIKRWLNEIKPGEDTYTKPVLPELADGIGTTEAPRGSLMHCISVKGKKIANYQAVPATIWNCCPRDDMDQRGPMEQALIGVPVPDPKNPVNVGRVVRAYDP